MSGKARIIRICVIIAVVIGFVVYRRDQLARETEANTARTNQIVDEGNAMMACINGAGPSSPQYRTATQDEIDTARNTLASHIREPDSAKLSDVRLVTKRCAPVTCGMINARNGFGGMSGNQPFAVAGNRVYLADVAGSDAAVIKYNCDVPS